MLAETRAPPWANVPSAGADGHQVPFRDASALPEEPFKFSFASGAESGVINRELDSAALQMGHEAGSSQRFRWSAS
jgi:hypothetical protein